MQSGTARHCCRCWRLRLRRSILYAYYRAWRLQGVWERIHTVLRRRLQRQCGREPTPSAAIMDSQSVKTTERGRPHGSHGGQEALGHIRHWLGEEQPPEQAIRQVFTAADRILRAGRLAPAEAE